MIKEFEYVLVTIHALQEYSNRRINYRDLATYVYITDKILNLKLLKKIMLVPGGAESLFLNSLLTILDSRGYINIDRGEISLTELGKKTVWELLSNPDKKDLRSVYRLLMEISGMEYDQILKLLSYIYRIDNGIEINNIPQEIISLYNKLRNMVSVRKEHDKILIEKQRKK